MTDTVWRLIPTNHYFAWAYVAFFSNKNVLIMGKTQFWQNGGHLSRKPGFNISSQWDLVFSLVVGHTNRHGDVVLTASLRWARLRYNWARKNDLTTHKPEHWQLSSAASAQRDSGTLCCTPAYRWYHSPVYTGSWPTTSAGAPSVCRCVSHGKQFIKIVTGMEHYHGTVLAVEQKRLSSWKWPLRRPGSEWSMTTSNW